MLLEAMWVVYILSLREKPQPHVKVTASSRIFFVASIAISAHPSDIVCPIPLQVAGQYGHPVAQMKARDLGIVVVKGHQI